MAAVFSLPRVVAKAEKSLRALGLTVSDTLGIVDL
jgi:hypothetical protein